MPLTRQEVQLAKAEWSEKASCFGRNAAGLAVGGAASFAGLLVLLLGLSALLGFAFESAGLNPRLAFFMGAFIIGGAIVLAGLAMVMKAFRTIRCGLV